MKIHFIYSDVSTYYYPGAHHGLASISSVLKSHGHLVSIHHFKKEPSRNEVLGIIQREAPDLLAFSSVTNQIGYVNTWSKWIKQEFATPTICGGIHTTLYPEEVIGFDGIDMVCRGEGEYPMLDLADDLERTDIKNLWLKRGSDITKNPLRALISPLDDLPYPDYALFDCQTMLADRNGDFAILASRGCPFNCTYCCNHALRGVQKGKGKYFRLQSVDYVLKELELLTEKYPIRHLSFADDVFGMSRDWSLEFCEKYPKKFGLEFECNVRADMVDEELLKSLQKANCTRINMGVEAGNEQLRGNILRRKMSNEQIIQAFDKAHKFGIKTLAYNMIGLPYETPEMIRETINLNKRLAPDNVAIFFFYPYPGTELYEVCKKEGFLSDRHSSSYVSESVLELPTISRKELRRLYTEFYSYALERRIQSFPTLLHPLLKITSSIMLKLLGKRAIEMLMQIYLRFFHIFSFLERKR
ncbi:B12-binding domain-containing radical SAM protein [Chloroflexota bacterium]